MEKYYNVSKEQYDAIEELLPEGSEFGFLSHNRLYTSENILKGLLDKHGALLELAIKQVTDLTLEEFKEDNESDSYLSYIVQKSKNQDGIDAYERLMGMIGSQGGLSGKVDTDQIPAYLKITPIRMMLKDGMFETCLRYWVTDIQPLNLLDTASNAIAVEIVETLCEKYGASEEVISAIKGLPKGSL